MLSFECHHYLLPWHIKLGVDMGFIVLEEAFGTDPCKVLKMSKNDSFFLNIGGHYREQGREERK